jgi:hypothetical protein
LARLIRWAIVASGTRNAVAISAVDGPATARSVSDRRRRGQRRMTAHEQQHQCVVPLRRLGAGQLAQRGGFLPAPPRLVAAVLVGQPPHGGLDEPTARVVRQPLGRPVHRGGQQRLLHGVLGGVEVAVASHDRAEDLGHWPWVSMVSATLGFCRSARAFADFGTVAITTCSPVHQNPIGITRGAPSTPA